MAEDAFTLQNKASSQQRAHNAKIPVTDPEKKGAQVSVANKLRCGIYLEVQTFSQDFANLWVANDTWSCG